MSIRSTNTNLIFSTFFYAKKGIHDINSVKKVRIIRVSNTEKFLGKIRVISISYKGFVWSKTVSNTVFLHDTWQILPEEDKNLVTDALQENFAIKTRIEVGEEIFPDCIFSYWIPPTI